MATWTPEELEISSARDDVSTRDPVTIWVVRLDDDLVDVRGEDAERIDAAYKEKYGYPSGPVEGITSPEAQATTIRLRPR